MRIVPIVNKNFMFRYKQVNNKIIDLVAGVEYTQADKLQASKLLGQLNSLGLQNAKIIDSGSKKQLFSIIA
jgi:hypothetical protein